MFCLKLWGNLPMQGRIRMYFFGNNLCKYRLNVVRIHMQVLTGGRDWGAITFKGAPKETNMQPQSARKWHKINLVLDTTRKQSHFWFQKIGLLYLLGLKQAKSDYFSEMGYLSEPQPLTSISLDPPLTTFPLAVDFFFCKNRCSSQIKVKMGQQLIRHVEYFKNVPSLFVTVLRLWQQGWVFTI